MKALKTIIATAVIVFALTTVAMAGMQHFTKAQNAQAAGKAPVSYTVTLSAQQLAQLMGDQGQKAGSQPAATQAKRSHHRHHATHVKRSVATYRPTVGARSSTSHSSGRSSYRCNGNGHSGGVASTSRHGNDCGDGGCW